MADEETLDGGSGSTEVQVTVVVVPGRVQAACTKLRALTRARAALVCVGVIAAVLAGVIVAAASNSSRPRQPPATFAARLAASDHVVTRFGVRVNCPRLTLVSPNGAYGRIDFEHTAPCGIFGNHLTLILHRVHGSWVHEFEASAWRCPMSQLPQSVAIELKLCPANSTADRHALQTH